MFKHRRVYRIGLQRRHHVRHCLAELRPFRGRQLPVDVAKSQGQMVLAVQKYRNVLESPDPLVLDQVSLQPDLEPCGEVGGYETFERGQIFAAG